MSLTPEEDEDLRRIAELATFGAFSPRTASLVRELRAKDRRANIRAPEVVAQWVPLRPAVSLPAQRQRDSAMDDGGSERSAVETLRGRQSAAERRLRPVVEHLVD